MSDPSTSQAGGSITPNPADAILQLVVKEQAYQDANTRLQTLEKELDGERKENEKLKNENAELASTSQQLKEAAEEARSAFLTLSSEVKDHRMRLDIVKNEKKELEADHERLKAKSRNDDDWIQKLRVQSTADGETIRKLDLERSQAIYEKDKYEHENTVIKSALENTRKEVERYSSALVEKDAEFAKYRNSHYQELQRAQAARDEEERKRLLVESIKVQLERDLDNKTRSLQETERRIDELRAQHSKDLSRYRSQNSDLRANNERLLNQLEESRQSVEALEKAVTKTQEEYTRVVAELEADLESALTAKETAEEKLKEMATVVERLSAAVGQGRGGAGTGDDGSDIYGISATASQLNGKSYAEFYADYARREVELTAAKQEIMRMEGLLNKVLSELQEKGPILAEQRKEYEEIKKEASELAKDLTETTQARTEAENARDIAQSELARRSSELTALSGQVSDLTLQVRVLTREVAIRDDPSLAFEPFEDETAAIGDDLDSIITSNLTAFRKLPQLVEQNKKLLRVARELGNKFEDLQGRVKNTQIAPSIDEDDDDIEAAFKSITYLTQEVQKLKANLVEAQATSDTYLKERDMFSRMLVEKQLSGGSVQLDDDAALEPVRKNMLDSVKKAFEDKHNALKQTINELQNKVQDAAQELEKARSDTTSAMAMLRDERNISESLRRAQSEDRLNLEHARETVRQKEGDIHRLQEKIQKLTEDLNFQQSEVKRIQSSLDMARGEKALLESLEVKARADIADMLQKNASLSHELSTRNLVIENNTAETNMKIASYESMNNSLQQDLNALRDELRKAKEAHQAAIDAAKDKVNAKETESLRARVAVLEAEAKSKAEELVQRTTELQKEVETARADERRKNVIGLKIKAQLDATRATLASTQQELTDTSTSLKEQIVTLQTEIDVLKKSIEQKDSELCAKDAELTAIRQAQAVAPTPAMASEQPDLQPRIDALTASEATLKTQLAQVQVRVTQLTSELEAKTKALEAVQTAQDGVKQQNETAEKQKSILSETLQKDKEELILRISELESTLSKAQADLQNVSSAPEASPADVAVDNGEHAPGAASEGSLAALAALQTEYDEYKKKQEELYEKNVRQVNRVNSVMKAKIDKSEAESNELKAQLANTKSESEVKTAIEEALAKQKSELELQTTAKSEPTDQQATAGAIYTEEQVAAIRADYEQKIAELKEQITKLEHDVEHWQKEYNLQKEIASKSAIKASMWDKRPKVVPAKPVTTNAVASSSTLPARPTQAAPGTVPTEVPVDQAALGNARPPPGNPFGRGMSIAGRGRGGRGGRGGVPAQRGGASNRGGITAASVLAAVEAGFAGKGPQAPKRRASENAEGQQTPSADGGKRAKLEGDGQSNANGNDSGKQPPPAS